jgi:thiol:disulfide interchange protein
VNPAGRWFEFVTAAQQRPLWMAYLLAAPGFFLLALAAWALVYTLRQPPPHRFADVCLVAFVGTLLLPLGLWRNRIRFDLAQYGRPS